jgi:hypothetical protein
MTNASHLTDRRKSPAWALTEGQVYRPMAAHPTKPQPMVNPIRRRTGRGTVGFWLGGVVCGSGGAIAGACMPYCQPVAVAISILWWGIYCGCFGASIGALFGFRRTTLSPAPTEDVGSRTLPSAAETMRIADTTAMLALTRWPRYVPMDVKSKVGPALKTERLDNNELTTGTSFFSPTFFNRKEKQP